MKRIVSVLLLAAALSFFASASYAQNTPAAGRMKTEEFRSRLSTVRDEKKRAAVERLDTRIKELNTKRASILLRHLNKIEEILNRIEIRALDVEKKGKDIAAVKTAIAAARTAIAAARTKIDEQAAKTYSIEITTEGKLGSAVSAARLALAHDLQAAHESVVAARKTIRDVLKELAKVIGEKLTTTTRE